MMINLEPEIIRQRLLIEGHYTIEISAEIIRRYLLDLAAHLDLKTYSEPIIYSPAAGTGKKINEGYDAFVPLVDSGIALYVWTNARFFSLIIYACKNFDETKAIDFTRVFYKTEGEIISRSF